MLNFDSGATYGDDEKDVYFMAQDYILASGCMSTIWMVRNILRHQGLKILR